MSSEVETSVELLTHAFSEQSARDSSTTLGMTEIPPRQFLCFFRCDNDTVRVPLLDVVCRNLQLVAVGIAEINRVRDFVILEFELDSAFF